MAYGERGNGKQTHHHTIDCHPQQNQQDSCNILMGDFGNMMNITPNARSDQWEIYNLLTIKNEGNGDIRRRGKHANVL